MKLKRQPKNQREELLNQRIQFILPKQKRTRSTPRLKFKRPIMPKLKLRFQLTLPKKLMLMFIKLKPRPSLLQPKFIKLTPRMLNQLKK